MKKLSKKLEELSSVFDNNELDNYVEKLDPQKVGNLLDNVETRIRQIISYYLNLKSKAKVEVKTDYFLKTILTTIKEAENEQLEKWRIIKEKILKKKKQNGIKKQERIKNNNHQRP